MQEAQPLQEKEPLPCTREAVDWWLKKWGRQSVLDRKESLTREDVERLIEVNGGHAFFLDLSWRFMRGIDLERLQGVRKSPPLSRREEQDVVEWEPGVDALVGVNLKNADLMSAKLRGVSLLMAELQGANLTRANLEGADFYKANLQKARLYRANLKKAKLEWADLKYTDIRRADLKCATLVRANLEGADLRSVNFGGADLEDIQISPGTNFENVEWGKEYISVLEKNGDYEAAIALYRRLKRWHESAGMLSIAGEFHYREREATRKAQWQRLGNEIRD